jgi:hypothetical protein
LRSAAAAKFQAPLATDDKEMNMLRLTFFKTLIEGSDPTELSTEPQENQNMLHRIGNFTTILIFSKGVFAVLLATALLASLTVSVAYGQEINCNKKQNRDDPACQGGGGGGEQEKAPARITFHNRNDDEILSDGSPYETASPPGDTIEVFIGTQANGGNIFLRTNSVNYPTTSSRQLVIKVPEVDSSCSFSKILAEEKYSFHFANVKVDTEVSDGLYGIQLGGTVSAPMKIRFFDGNGAPFFLNFDTKDKGVCKGGSDFVHVKRITETQWRVFSGDPLLNISPSRACLEQHNSKGKNFRCAEGEMEFSYIIDDISAP